MRIQTPEDQQLQAPPDVIERLYRLADRVGRAGGLDDICEAALDAIVQIVGVERASILMFDDRQVMRFRAWRGLSDAYRAAVDGHSPWTPDVRDPLPIVVEDVLTDDSLAAFRGTFHSEGIRALGFIPLMYYGRLLGKFMLYHARPHHFSVEEVRLAGTIAHHVGFGIARAQADAEVAHALQRERVARAEADAARAQAERASQAKDEFLAMLAHELRNPLGVIATALAVLEGTVPSDPQYSRSRAAIRRQTDHLARLLDDLLDVARVTKGEIHLQRVPQDLRVTVENGVEDQRSFIEQKKQSLFLDIPREPVIAMGDPVRLQQVFGNILNNAAKYTPVGGTISVALAAQDGYARLRVRDNGAGIAPEQLEWIFDLFAQANPTLARTEGGLGVGLTVARQLVELHGGRVHAASEGFGRGAEFIVELPLVEPKAITTDDPAIAHTGRTTKRILVIEDNDDAREMLAGALRLRGHEVFEAHTGRTGIEQARLHPVDVVLVDIGLPDILGYEVAKELRSSADPDVRFIAITGYGAAADRARSRASGFHAHLLKPIDPVRLAGMLENLTSLPEP
jgi:signal transduction histidine kinase